MSALPFPSARAAGARTDEFRERVDALLARFLTEQRRLVSESDRRAEALVARIEAAVRAGGKRLRPLFCIWGHLAAGGSAAASEREAPVVGVAAALEMLHTFAIFHDDVMDRSPLRRGEPAAHRAFAAAAPGGDPERFGASAAVLAGDLAAAFADSLLYGCGFGWEELRRGAAIYHAMRTEVIAGQYLDVLGAARGEVSTAEARRIAALKSGGYTVEKPLLIGAALAGAPSETMAALSAFGAPLGEAFQLRDDVLGAFGDPQETGKDAESDFREGKPTLLVAVAFERARPEDRLFLSRRLGAADLLPGEIERIRALLQESGALDEVSARIGDLLAGAWAALDGAPIDRDAAAALRELAELSALRSR